MTYHVLPPPDTRNVGPIFTWPCVVNTYFFLSVQLLGAQNTVLAEGNRGI